MRSPVYLSFMYLMEMLSVAYGRTVLFCSPAALFCLTDESAEYTYESYYDELAKDKILFFQVCWIFVKIRYYLHCKTVVMKVNDTLKKKYCYSVLIWVCPSICLHFLLVIVYEQVYTTFYVHILCSIARSILLFCL